MKKVNSDELRPEYYREELGDGVRGKYFENFQKGTNLVLLNPEVAEALPTDEAVNNALKFLIDIATKSVDKSKQNNNMKKF